MPMVNLRFLRRMGALRRIFFGVSLILLTVFFIQTYVLHSSDERSSVSLPETGRNVSKPFLSHTSHVVVHEQSLEKGTFACKLAKTCESGKLSYRVSSSIEESRKPEACINDLLIFDRAKLVKGLNVIILDEETRAVQDIKYFDMLQNDKEFIGFMVHTPGQRVVIFVSWGDVSDRLSADSREILEKFGSKLVANLKRGSSFVMIGQKGLEQGAAVEHVAMLTEKDSVVVSEVAGCLSIPLGKVNEKVSLLGHAHNHNLPHIPNAQISRRDKFLYGQELAHCGAKNKCPLNHFSLSVYSGKHKDDVPRMCINGRFIIDRNLNKAGRGLNIVVLNSTGDDILRVGHFDTYAEDSNQLELFLEQMMKGEIIVVLSFDEASTRLSQLAKQMFYELGSGLVQNLKFRASWYFVGQKGISGFTPFEELNFAQGSEWAKPVDQRLCIPHRIDGRKVRPDPIVSTKNEARRNFCKQYDGYEEFCDDSKVDDVLTPSPLNNKSMEGDAIFKVPILVVAGLSHNSLRLCLETLLRQPGIDPNMVLVTFDENYPEGGSLAKLFGFKTRAVNASASYSSQFAKSLAAVWEDFPSANTVIVVEEELILAVDFLLYMAQMFPILQKDKSILSISAWNDNGFEGASSLRDAAYRVETFPGLAFMLRKDTYKTFMENKMSTCCVERAWDGWLSAEQRSNKYTIIPEVSRVLRRHSDGLGVLEPRLEDLFHRTRTYTKAQQSWIAHPEHLIGDAYDKQIGHEISRGKPLNQQDLRSCFAPTPKAPTLPAGEEPTKQLIWRQALVIFLEQTSGADQKLLQELCRCFGLYYSDGQPSRATYKGILRFSYQSRPMIIVGSVSPFYSQKPAGHAALKSPL